MHTGLATPCPSHPQAPRLDAVKQLVEQVVADQRQNGPAAGNADSGPAHVPKAKQLEHALRLCSPITVSSDDLFCMTHRWVRGSHDAAAARAGVVKCANILHTRRHTPCAA
jgi:hypothetical protein